MESIESLIEALTDKNTVRGCGAADALVAESEKSNAVYAYFPYFIKLMTDSNSYVRTRAMALIAANVRWDEERALDGAIEEFLTHILDVKPITSRQCIKLLPGIARLRPDLLPEIRESLTKANPYCYAESMRPLVEKDILNALKELETIAG